MAELVELQLVIESEPDAGLVTLGGTVLKRVRQSTGHTPSASEAVDTAARIIERMRGELEGQHCIAGIGVAVPGLVNSSDGVVRLAPHLGWVDEPLGEMLRRATGLRVVAGNDATLGSLAESTSWPIRRRY